MTDALKNTTATDLKCMIEFCKERLQNYRESNKGTVASYEEPFKTIVIQQDQLERMLQTKINELCR